MPALKKSGAARRVHVGQIVNPIAPLPVVQVDIRLARALGAEDLWLPDHVAHALPDSLWREFPMSRIIPSLDAWYDPTVLIAKYAKAGRRMGTMVSDPVRRSAADLARAWMTLHHATRGNVVFGIGAGERMNLDPIGVPADRPVSRLEDTLTAIRAAWAAKGKPVTHSGPFHTWDAAPFLPPRRGTPPIWVAADGPRTCGIAGALGDGWISMAQDVKAWQKSAQLVASGAESAGRDVNDIVHCVLATIVIVSDPAHLEQVFSAPIVKVIALITGSRAWAAAGFDHPCGDNFSGVNDLDPAVFEGERWEELQRIISPEVISRVLPCGTAATLAEQFAEYADHGLSHLVFSNVALTAGGTSAGLGVLKGSVLEQRKLIRLMKTMQPGSLR